MDQKKTNQERGRKSGGSSSFMDKGEPSRAPRQDEDGRDGAPPTAVPRHYADDATKQGISNRPADEEHAFPESDNSAESVDAPSIETTPKQVGGNRGSV